MNSPQTDCELSANQFGVAPETRLRQPPAMFFQRLAGEWLDLARKSVESSGIQPTLVGQASIDLLEVLRTELLMRLGSDLSAIHRKRTSQIAAAPAGDLAQASLRRSWWDSLHIMAYHVKRKLLWGRGNKLSSTGAASRAGMLVIVRT